MTTTETPTTDTNPAPNDDLGPDFVVHIVSDLQWFLDMVLRVKVPRALCGELLIAKPGEPDALAEGAPPCPRCAEILKHSPRLAGWFGPFK